MNFVIFCDQKKQQNKITQKNKLNESEKSLQRNAFATISLHGLSTGLNWAAKNAALLTSYAVTCV